MWYIYIAVFVFIYKYKIWPYDVGKGVEGGREGGGERENGGKAD